MQKLMIGILFICLFWQVNFAQIPTNIGGWVPTSGTGVYTFAQDANYIYLGGNFTYMIKDGVNGIVGTSGTGVQTTGTGAVILDFPKVNEVIRAVVADGNGGWYIGGDFTQVGGVTRNRIAHINADKTLDNTWNPNVNGDVYVLVLSGTDLFVGGDFTSIGSQTRNRLAKLSTTGTGVVDVTWNPNLNERVETLALSGTDLYVGGVFSSVGGQIRKGIAKLSTIGTGVADATWNPNPDAFGWVYALALSGTDLYVGGHFTSIGGQSRNHIAKLSTTGTGAADATWNPNPNSWVDVLALSGTDLYVGGGFTSIGGQARNKLAKLSTIGTGMADATWNPNPNSWVYGLALSGTDLYVGGLFSNIGGQTRDNIAKLSTTGTGVADATWNPNPSHYVQALAISGTSLYIGGGIGTIGGIPRNHIVRLQKSNLELDMTWNPNPSNWVDALVVSGTDLYAAGGFINIGGQPRAGIAKLSTTGTGMADATWNAYSNGVVHSLAISGTDLYAAGGFINIGGQPRNGIAKLSTSTGLADATWNPNPNGYVQTLALSGTDLYVGGGFTSIGGQPRNNIAKLSITGTGAADAIWNPDASNIVETLTVSRTDVYVGGWFTSIGGQTRNLIAKLSITGTGVADATWNPDAGNPNNNKVEVLVLSGTDLYVGGVFTSIGGQPRNNIAKLSTTGAGVADATWNPDVKNPNSTRVVRGLSLFGTDLYVGGNFTNIGGQIETPYLAIFDIPGIYSSGLVSSMNMVYGTASIPSSFSVSGYKLNEGITITPPAAFEISLSAGSGYANSLVVGTAGNTSATTIYVRLKATTAVGSYSGNIVLSSSGVSNVDVPIPNSTVSAKELTISDIAANSKEYDGNTTTSLSGTATLTGEVVSGDVVSLSGAPTASFNNASVGTNKPVTVTGYTLSGVSAGNYTLTYPTGLTANITAKNLTISGITANNKEYDGNNTATLSGTPVLVGVVSGDVVSASGTPMASFNNALLGNSKPVTVTGYTLSGVSAGNYTLTQPTSLTANITVKSLTITGLTVSNKEYDGNNTATFSGSAILMGVVTGENVSLVGTPSATFDNVSVGNNKTVAVMGWSLSGTDIANYSLVSPVLLTANITAKSLTITGLTANDKSFDGNTTTSLSGTATLVGVLSGDVVSLSGTPIANFDDISVGTNKPVTVTGYTLSGTSAGNYSLSPLVLTANITKNQIRVFPNPTQERVTISLPSSEKVQVRVWDVCGKLLDSYSYDSGLNILEVSLSAYGAGLYMIELIYQDTSIVRKVVKI